VEFKVKSKLSDARGLSRTITRLSHEILERCEVTENLKIIGIRTRGEYVAQRIASAIEKIEGEEVDVGVLDVVMYRDDFRSKHKLPEVQVTDIPFDIDGKTLILVDDVIYTGRTIRAALDALVDFGRAAKIQLAVLVDRGHREMPINADYVGRNVPTADNQEIRVNVKECDNEDSILLVERTE